MELSQFTPSGSLIKSRQTIQKKRFFILSMSKKRRNINVIGSYLEKLHFLYVLSKATDAYRMEYRGTVCGKIILKECSRISILSSWQLNIEISP